MDTKTIVLLLVAVLISLVSKYYENKMKKQQKQQSQTPDSHDESSMEEVLRKFLSEDELEDNTIVEENSEPTTSFETLKPHVQSLEVQTPKVQSLEEQSPLEQALSSSQEQRLETLTREEPQRGESIFEQWQKTRSSNVLTSSYSMIAEPKNEKTENQVTLNDAKTPQEDSSKEYHTPVNISLRDAVVYSEILNRKYF